MKKIWIAMGLCALLIAPAALFAFPTVYPTGTTIYKPDKCQNGFTVYATETEGEGSVLIDMNGNVVKQWKNMSNLDHPVKILQGGYIMGSTREKVGARRPGVEAPRIDGSLDHGLERQDRLVLPQGGDAPRFPASRAIRSATGCRGCR